MLNGTVIKCQFKTNLCSYTLTAERRVAHVTVFLDVNRKFAKSLFFEAVYKCVKEKL